MKDKKRIERDITAIKTCITNYEKDLAEAEKELAEVEKPKPLKFGDKVIYKGNNNNKLRLILYWKDDGGLAVFDEDGLIVGTQLDNYESTGESIFDDLKEKLKKS